MFFRRGRISVSAADEEESNKNADKKTPMASLTKITTAMVVLEKADDLQRVCTVTQDELDELAGTNSSTALPLTALLRCFRRHSTPSTVTWS